MGYFFGVTAELVMIIGLSFLQWRLFRLAISYIRSHLAPVPARILQWLMAAAGILLAFGLLLSLPEAARLPLNPQLFGWLRGGSG